MISVIVPCYNAASTLEIALKGLERQTFRDFEIIMVDDGSADNTIEVAQSWCARRPYMRLVQRPHAGVSATRNAGLREARGEWLLFHDADDFLSPTALSRLAKAAAQSPDHGVVVGRTARIDSSGRAWPFPLWDLSDAAGTLAYGCALAIHSALVRRKCVLEVSGFDEGLTSAEDWDLWRRIAFRGQRFHQISNVVAFYRSQAGSLSKDIRRLAANTMTVMRRGHGDMPAGRESQAVLDNRARHTTTFLLWSAARAIVADQDENAILALNDGEPLVAIEPEELADMLSAGMADFIQVQPFDLAPNWPTYVARLQALMAKVYPRPEEQRSRDLALLTLKDRLGVVFGHGAHPDSLAVVEGVCDLEAEIQPLKSELPIAAIQLRRGPRSAGLLICPIEGELGADAIRKAAVVGARYLPLKALVSSLTPWRSVAFWPAVTTAALGASARLLKAPRAKLKPTAVASARSTLIRGIDAQIRSALGTGSAGSATTMRAAGGQTLPVLMYHRIAADGPEALARYRISPTAFEAQMRWLSDKGFISVTPEQLQAIRQGREAAPRRPVMITFDDGYLDFAESAQPILKRFGFTASVFVVPGKVGGASDWDAEAGEPAPMMTWAQIRDMAAQGVSIGSHSQTHRRLSRLSTGEIEQEAAVSRARLAEELGAEPMAFCYPYGDHDRAVSALVARAGYSLAFTCREKVSNVDDDPFRLPRIEVHGEMTLKRFTEVLRPQ
jgi:peptidoglycan/xylan/chitin deacetylase (PgdA/CDA1 family)